MRDPLGNPHAWYVLLEFTAQAEGTLDATLEGLLEAAIETGLIEDAAVAASGDQRKMFWRLRELMSEVQKHEGGSIKHDVSVPIGAVPRFLADTDAALAKAVPGARPILFGHLGDGNIHANISQPEGADKQAFLDRWDEVNTIVHDLVARVRRFDLRRTRHRRDEARSAARRERPGGARRHAAAQERARPARHSQSGEGPVTQKNIGRFR